MRSNSNMNSNLPLIFANGFPTSIDKITREQLQTFIPFLVQCSLGHDTMKQLAMPVWWPDNVPMISPNTKPTCNEHDWLELLKTIVLKCYRFHNCEYLVTFCNELTRYHRNNLRYINNFNGTTSLYVKGKGKLLCTFRNENISYDKVEEESRKCLKPRIVNVIKILDDEEDDDEMVTTETVDVFICEVCNMELESLADMQEHELVCDINKEVSPAPENVTDQDKDRTNFLNYFKLSSNNNSSEKNPVKPSSPVKHLLNTTRRTRGHCDLKRSRIIPFSSPAGKVLLKTANLEMDKETLAEKLIKIEKMCPAPDIDSAMPKFMNPKFKINKTYKVSYKKKASDYERLYQFPVGHVLSRGKCDEKKYLEKYLDLDNSQIRTFKPVHEDVSMAVHENNKNTESVIDLCSSDEEDTPDSEIDVKEEQKSILQNILTAPQETNVKELDSYEDMPEVSITINGAPTICKISEILYTKKGVLQSSEKFTKECTEYIDLCSSDEETILPDLPNYPHLTMMQIPVGTSLS